MKQSPRNTVLKPSEQIRRTSLQVILSEVQSPNHALKFSFRTGYGQRLMRTFLLPVLSFEEGTGFCE